LAKETKRLLQLAPVSKSPKAPVSVGALMLYKINRHYHKLFSKRGYEIWKVKFFITLFASHIIFEKLLELCYFKASHYILWHYHAPDSAGKGQIGRAAAAAPSCHPMGIISVL
jgi:hypothetical protein